MCSGQLPLVDGVLTLTGKAGAEATVDQAADQARIACLNALAAVSSVAGGIDRITSVVKVCVYVASTPDFTQQPEVANGASNLLGEVFGDQGAHVRSAVGVAVLPRDAVVEVELIVTVES